MIFMAPLVRGHVRQQGHRAGALDRVREIALVARAAAGDAARNDLAALGDQAAEPAHVLVIDEIDLVRAELADLPPAEPAALHWLLGTRGNGSSPLLLERNVVVRAAAGAGGFVGEGGHGDGG